MTAIQNPTNVPVSKPQEQRTNNKQQPVYRVQTQPSNDTYVRQPRYIQTQNPMLDPRRQQNRGVNKDKLKSNLTWGIGIASGLAIIGMVCVPAVKSLFSKDAQKAKELKEAIKHIKDVGIKREAEEEMARKEYERSLYRIADLVSLDKLANKVETKTPADIQAVKQRLDSEIIGMEEAKQPILDFLESINYDIKAGINNDRPIILALDGPPGTGKSSLMKAIADALGMYFKKISMSATKNSESIIGFERTYVGATPGVIAKAQLEGNTKKVVYGLDEFEKGDEKVMNTFLSLLDDQKIFTDRYYNSNIDLSQSMFIITTNELERLRGTPIYSRIKPHVININPYDAGVKSRIAQQKMSYLLESNKMSDKVNIADDVYAAIAEKAPDEGGRYTAQLVDKLITDMKKQLNHTPENKKLEVDAEYVKKVFEKINLE